MCQRPHVLSPSCVEWDGDVNGWGIERRFSGATAVDEYVGGELTIAHGVLRRVEVYVGHCAISASGDFEASRVAVCPRLERDRWRPVVVDVGCDCACVCHHASSPWMNALSEHTRSSSFVIVG